MILFDTSVILDPRDPSTAFHTWARNKIAEAVAGDGAAANTVVISESSVRSKDPEAVPNILQTMGLTLLPLPISAAVPAAKAFAVYLDRLKKAKRLLLDHPCRIFLSVRTPLRRDWLWARAIRIGFAHIFLR